MGRAKPLLLPAPLTPTPAGISVRLLSPRVVVVVAAGNQFHLHPSRPVHGSSLMVCDVTVITAHSHGQTRRRQLENGNSTQREALHSSPGKVSRLGRDLAKKDPFNIDSIPFFAILTSVCVLFTTSIFFRAKVSLNILLP